MALIHLRVLFCRSNSVSKESRKYLRYCFHNIAHFLFLSFTSSRERSSVFNSSLLFLGKGPRPMGLFSSLPTSKLLWS